jgi:hypothetical protein
MHPNRVLQLKRRFPETNAYEKLLKADRDSHVPILTFQAPSVNELNSDRYSRNTHGDQAFYFHSTSQTRQTVPRLSSLG